MRRIKHKPSSRGLTLIEVAVSLGVFVVAGVGVLWMLEQLQTANRRAAFQRVSLEALAQLEAQIDSAPCDMLPTDVAPAAPQVDPILLTAGAIGPCTAPICANLAAPVPIPGGTVVDYLGNQNTTPPVFVTMQTVQEVGPATRAPAFDITVQVREITGDPTRDQIAVTQGPWIREFPLKKICTQRNEDVGRGEFYN